MKKNFTQHKMNTSLIDEKRFQLACDLVSGKSIGLQGIGTMQEKSVHAVLKHYFEPDSKYHETAIGGFVADICKEGEIIEIQSKSFYVMKHKLSEFLKEYEVTIVYPVALTKYLIWIDPQSGQVQPTRKSSKKGHIYQLVPELYSIREFLSHPNLHFHICFIEMEEYKLLDGYGKNKKVKATKTDRFPTKLLGEFRINTTGDLLTLLPEGLPDNFTSEDLKMASGCMIDEARILLTLLYRENLIERCGKQGRYYQYKINPPVSN